MPCVEEQNMTKERMNKLWWMVSAIVLLFVAAAIMPVAASTISPYNGVHLKVHNIYYNYTGNGTYWFNIGGGVAGGGLNAFHITNTTNDAFVSGTLNKRTLSDGLNGSFYFSDTGGRGYEDEAILLIAVNESTDVEGSDSFTIRVNTSGYHWVPNASGYAPLPTETGQFIPISHDHVYTQADFLTFGGGTVFQNWRPSSKSNYPVFSQERTLQSPVEPNFHYLLIDLNVSVLGSNVNATYRNSLTNKGMPLITYNITTYSTPIKVAFDAYAWNKNPKSSMLNTTGWSNSLTNSSESVAGSGWYVEL
jgi:hypothetical protein